MEDEILLIKNVEERSGKTSGNPFWSVATDKGEYTCHEKQIADKLIANKGNKCKLSTLRGEKYNNIKGFIECVEVVTTAEKEAVKSSGGHRGANIEMLVSYAKDLVIAGKESGMGKAIESVIGAYQKASGEL